MRAIFQRRTGLYNGAENVAPPTYAGIRVTVPARELLIAHGAQVAPEPTAGGVVQTYTVALAGRVPAGIVAVRAPVAPGSRRYVLALRLQHEPEYPGEIPAAWWELGDWLPCPRCGAPLVWYEAGHVPGYRVCTRPPYHHVRLTLGRRP